MGSNKVGDIRCLSAASIPTQATSNRQSSLRLYSMSTSLEEEKEAIQSFLDARQSHLSQMCKMMMVIAIPVISQMALSILNLTRATSVQDSVAQAQKGIHTFFLIDDLVTDLQVERGTTASYLSSLRSDRNAYNRLVYIRQNSDNSLNKLQDWPQEGLRIGYRVFDTKLIFKDYLEAFRKRVEETNVLFETNIIFYTEITEAFIDWGQRAVVLPEKGKIWPSLITQVSLIRASDAIGIRRALGSTFITRCKMSKKGLAWFTSLKGEARASLFFAFGYHQKTRQIYENAYVGTMLEAELAEQEYILSSSNFSQKCYKYTIEERYFQSHVWFSNMTIYLIIIKDIRGNLTEEILHLLKNLTQSQQVEVIVYSVIVGLVIILCLILTFWYSAKLHKMMSKITIYAKKVSVKSAELAAEKKRSETLLYQLLPKAVADQLKVNKEVKAEHYGKVTIMFSDIVDFTSLCALSSPLQVVEMLNILYSVFDASLDRYDVYKVETIGDAYMVVSGVPTPIEHHALAVTHLSLELMVNIEDVQVPHMTAWHLQMRVGIHTGSCVAGVVGVKMPRYCLFGDTVNTASRMESSGIAKKIQISQSTKDVLDSHGGFRTEQRGTVGIKGKGDMNTYFLIGCEGSTCHHITHPITGSQLRRASGCTIHSHKELNLKC